MAEPPSDPVRPDSDPGPPLSDADPIVPPHPERSAPSAGPSGGTITADDADGLMVDVTLDDLGTESAEDMLVARMLDQTIDMVAFAPAVEAQDPPDAADTLEELEPHEASEVVYRMDDEAVARALVEMDVPLALGVLRDTDDRHGAGEAARYLALMDPDDAVDLVQAMEDDLREEILDALPPDRLAKIRRLSGYDPESAGGLMTTDFVSIPDDVTVAEAIRRIRSHPVSRFEHVYVLDRKNRLVGVISCRKLLVSARSDLIEALMHTHVDMLRPDLDQEEIAQIFDRYHYTVMPVVDDSGRLAGVVTVDDVIDAIREEATEDTHKMVGAGKEEAVYSSLAQKIRSRLPWLLVNLGTSLFAVSIVFRYDEVIGRLAILAALMPMIANLAGNAGQQSLAVTIRGLVVGEVRSSRVWPLIWRELLLGLITGVVIGGLVAVTLGLLGMTGLVSDASWRLGLVVLLSMTGSLATGCFVGTTLPLLMERLKADPATASTIFLSAVTDFISFFTFLGLAWVLQGSLLDAAG